MPAAHGQPLGCQCQHEPTGSVGIAADGASGGGELMSAVKATLQRTAARSDVPVLKEPSTETLCKRVVVTGGVLGAIVIVLFLLLRSVAESQSVAEL